RNMQTPYANFEFYSLRLRARDWQREQGEGSCQRIHAGCVANFSKGKEKIALTMTRAADFSTVLVANIEGAFQGIQGGREPCDSTGHPRGRTRIALDAGS